MLAAAPTDETPMLTFIVTKPGQRLSVTLPQDATLLALHEAVATEAEIVPGTFELCESARDDGTEVAHRLDDTGAYTTTLLQASFRHKQRLLLRGVDGCTPVPQSDSRSSAAAQALGTVALWNSSQSSPIAGLSQGLAALGSGAGCTAPPNAEGFVGLVNQGATCYLSSLLQSLYMTPEFRRIVYQWRPRGEPTAAGEGERGEDSSAAGSSSITAQLQRLFVAMQDGQATNASLAEAEAAAGAADAGAAGEGKLRAGGCGSVRAIDTRELTQSFGWGAADSFTQHDVQELLRVLFDALEAELVGTAQEGALAELYGGEWEEFVQCRACLRESARASAFHELSLPVRTFQSPPVKLDSLGG